MHVLATSLNKRDLFFIIVELGRNSVVERLSGAGEAAFLFDGFCRVREAFNQHRKVQLSSQFSASKLVGYKAWSIYKLTKKGPRKWEKTTVAVR
jgi:hypothetical protein